VKEIQLKKQSVMQDPAQWTVTGAITLHGVSVRHLAEEVLWSEAGIVTAQHQRMEVTPARERLQTTRPVTRIHVLLTENGRNGETMVNALSNAGLVLHKEKDPVTAQLLHMVVKNVSGMPLIQRQRSVEVGVGPARATATGASSQSGAIAANSAEEA